MNLEELKRRLGLEVFDRSPCHVAVVDSELRVVLSNGAFDQTFGSERAPYCHRLYKSSEQPCESCVAAEVFADGREHVSAEDGLSAANTAVRYQVRGIPVRGEDGAVELVLLISVDTSRVTELEEALRQAERLANVGLSTAGLAHTIKNILAGLDGGAYMVTTGIDKQNEARTRAGWQMVQQYIDQVTTLVKNLLSYARPRDRAREPVEVAALVDDVLGLYRERASTSGTTLEANVDAGLPAVDMDRASMHATLANMVANAIDACTWDPDLDKTHRVVVVAHHRDGRLCLEVADNGTGIAAEHQPKVLHAFFTTKGIRGTGLGLLLSKQAVADHGGTIDFESTPGQGTRFRIELPVTPEGGPS